MAKATTGKTVVSLKVTLRGSKPPIWRRLLVPGSMNLHDLHLAIQMTMGWHGGHLHAFEASGQQYGDPTDMDDVASERRMTLNNLVKSGVAKFTYTYDFGDDWEHQIVIEKPHPVVAGQAYPACVAGKRNGPPDDCGGIWGYEELLEILANPAHPERAERLEWIGGEFDPEEFSVEDADTALAGCFERKPGS
jgi:hypothetical protein